MTVALIAQHYLTPDAQKQITAMLAADTDNLTKHDIASEATWADKYRDSNNRRSHYTQTRNWHYVDMEISSPDINMACFGRRPLPAGTLAANGDPNACVVDSSPTGFARRRLGECHCAGRALCRAFLRGVSRRHARTNHSTGRAAFRRSRFAPVAWRNLPQFAPQTRILRALK